MGVILTEFVYGLINISTINIIIIFGSNPIQHLFFFAFLLLVLSFYNTVP